MPVTVPDESAATAIRAEGVAKYFGPVAANRDASLLVRQGEIHALVGENGAGKSTLMRVLSGMYAPDAGRVEILGRDATGWSTAQAIDAGVGMVHQHFMLVPTLTVAENVVLGREPHRGVVFDRAAAEREVTALVERTGLRVEPGRLVADLSVGEAQRVEILKVLYRGARLLILDEPTAVLSPPEVEELWTVLRGLRDRGDTIVLITHKLDEVIAVSDTITVMRAGRTVERMPTAGATPAGIARAMVGRDVTLADAGSARGGPPTGNVVPPAPRPDTTTTPTGAERRPATPALSVRSLVVAGPRTARAVDDVTFDVMPGEILGIAGVEGNGQTELVEAIAGLRAPSSGTISAGGRDLTRLTVRDRADLGISHVPEDRHRRGLVLDYSIADNLILGRQHHFGGSGGLDRAKVGRNAAEQVQRFDIRPADPALPARALSGGNQQKIVIAREMGRAFTVLLAAQPTRGVDVGAIEFIHAQIRAARAAGKAVLLVSAELSEILALSDRIAVLYRGRIATVMARAEASEQALGPYMTGATTGGEAAA